MSLNLKRTSINRNFKETIMKSKMITLIFIGTMLVTGILSGMAFADRGNMPSFEDRQDRMEMKHEKRMDAMADVLDLSEAQQEQISAIHEKERAEKEGSMQQMREDHEQMRTLLESDTFDENAIRSLANIQAILKTEMFVSRAKVKHEIFQLLTAEQQELAKKIKPLLHEQGKHHQPMKGF
jgi:protein CpxP